MSPPTPPSSASPDSDAETAHIMEDVATAVAELSLLDSDVPSGALRLGQEHEMNTAPILTRDAYNAAGFAERKSQYGLLGKIISIGQTRNFMDPRLYVNTNAPFSAVVCGVQGSGKSHTVSALLENFFIEDYSPIGQLQKSLAGLILHFGEGGQSSNPCEAAYLGIPTTTGITTPKVRVYVSKSSLETMKHVYEPLGASVTLEPLRFHESELDAEAFLAMMAVGKSDSAPLYMQIVLTILRELGERFTYQRFKNELELAKQSFNTSQLSSLEQRMSLLESFMLKPSENLTCKRFQQGQLTIVDLSDPFIDAASACGLFQIITRLFVRADVDTGKVLVVDEAHKYLSKSNTSSGLTRTLLQLVREQRHQGMRVIVSTQEPTVIPTTLLELFSIAILHRFSSPAWWEHVAKHVSAKLSSDEGFDQIVSLQTGEAIILAPAGLGVFSSQESGASGHMDKQVACFGRRHIVVKTRKRITKDGGSSIMVLA